MKWPWQPDSVTYTYDEQKKNQQDSRIEEAKTTLLQKQYQQQAQEQSKHGVLNTPLGWITTFVGAAFGLLVLIGLAMLRR